MAIAGADCALPLSIASDWRINSDGGLRLRLRGRHTLRERFRFTWRWNTDGEYRAHLSYRIGKRTALIGGHDSDFDLGMGLEWRY